MKLQNHKQSHGFSVVEILIVIVVIGILAGIVLTNIANSRERAYRARADSEILALGNATSLYANKYNVFPADVERDIPAGIKEFVNADQSADAWPDAPWPGSVYDYDSWDLWNEAAGTATTDGIFETIQISVRFCPLSGPANLSDCKIPKETWADGFLRKSSFYYCVKGYCRPHKDESVTYKGYCVNCPGNTAKPRPNGS